jgi:DNA-binding GntR family transcriptional regulator
MVYESLRDAIFAGTLRPGDRLRVPVLAEKLGVSRSPVREAVLRLTQERLAWEEPRHGAVVAVIGRRELAGLYQVREVLEGLAARLAAGRGDAQLADRLREVLSDHEQAVDEADLSRHMEVDMLFHSLVRCASGNAEVVRLHGEIQTRVRLAMLTTAVTGGLRNALTDRRAIYDKIRAGDAERAEGAAKAHVARLRCSLLEEDGTAVGRAGTR